jgi:hypothetical protein
VLTNIALPNYARLPIMAQSPCVGSLIGSRRVKGRKWLVTKKHRALNLGPDWIPGDMGAVAPAGRRPGFERPLFKSEMLIYLGWINGRQAWRGHIGPGKSISNANEWAQYVGGWSPVQTIYTPDVLFFPTVGLDMEMTGREG